VSLIASDILDLGDCNSIFVTDNFSVVMAETFGGPELRAHERLKQLNRSTHSPKHELSF
jgi:hypothetical protein